MSQPGPRSCAACGQVVEQRARFCPRCGHVLAAVAPAPARPRRLAIFAGLAVVVAGGIAALVLTRTGAPARQDASAGSTPSTPGGAYGSVDGAAAPTDDPPPVANPNGQGASPDDGATATLTGALEFGDLEPVVTAAVSVAGATVGGAGISLEFPPGAVPATAQVAITRAPVVGSSLPAFMRPATALFRIDVEGADLAEPVAVTLPMTLAPDEVPMVFWYADDGGLTPLPPISHTADTVTVSAPHFSAVVGFGLAAAGMPQVADSGFRPGKDDWQFVNYGAFVAPGGLCEGMSLSAIWYYAEQHRRAGASRLHGLYDNDGADPPTPGFQDDDAQAYRFASAVHKDPIAARPTYLAFRNRWALPDVRLTLAALRMAIYATGEPQLLRITTDPAKGGGHTMIVYRVARNRIFIADPNWPGQYRWIDVDEAKGAFLPYSSGANARAIAEQGATAFPFISYVPWRIARSTAAIAARWAELEANTAGATTFPPVALGLITGRTPEGKAQVTYTTARTLQTELAHVPLVVRPLPGADQTSMRIYRGPPPTPVGEWGGTQELALEPGDNHVGVLVKGRVQDGTDANGNPTWTWGYVDYVRLTITRGETTPARGRWVLTAAAADGGATAQSFTKPDETLTVASANGGVRVDYEYVGPPHRKESVVTAWSAPPAAMAPGETWRGTLSARGTCPGEYDQGWAGNVTLSIIPAGAGSDGITSSSAGVTCDKAEASATFAWTFPASGPGLEHIDVLVSAGESHGGDSWTYRYEWAP